MFLVKACARAGKTLISRLNLRPSGSCRALRACLLAVPVAFCEGLRPPQKPSSTVEVKSADGRFRVSADITIVPRAECVSFDVIYWMVYSSARILSGPSELPLSLRLIIYKDTLYFSFFGILVFLLNV